MVLYPYVAGLAFDGMTGEKAANATGQVFAKSDSSFANPLPTLDASGLAIELTSNNDGILPTFFVDGNTAVNWKSGDWVFPLVTSEPIPGPVGPPGADSTVPGPQGEGIVTPEAVAANLPVRLGEVAINATISEHKTAAHDRFVSHLNGTFPTSPAASGQTWQKIQNSAPGSTLEIINGSLTNTATNDGTAAGYAEINMGSPVTRVGARFVLQPGGTKGTDPFDFGGIEIGVWKEPISENFPTIPNSPCHLVIYPEYWNYGVWDRDGAGMLQQLKTVYFKKPLATDGSTIHEVDVYFEGETAHVRMPDGTLTKITDPRISERKGNYAQWEIYQQNASRHTKAAFTEVWAETAEITPYSTGASQALGVLTALRKTQETTPPAAAAKRYADTTSTLYTATTTAVDVATGNATIKFRMPESGRVTLEIQAFLEMSAPTQVFWILRDTVDRFTQMITNQQFTGMVKVIDIMTGTPGTDYTLQLKHSATTAGTASIRSHQGTGRPIVIKATPLEA